LKITRSLTSNFAFSIYISYSHSQANCMFNFYFTFPAEREKLVIFSYLQVTKYFFMFNIKNYDDDSSMVIILKVWKNTIWMVQQHKLCTKIRSFSLRKQFSFGTMPDTLCCYLLFDIDSMTFTTSVMLFFLTPILCLFLSFSLLDDDDKIDRANKIQNKCTC
jgi:hypothetical protein